MHPSASAQVDRQDEAKACITHAYTRAHTHTCTLYLHTGALWGRLPRTPEDSSSNEEDEEAHLGSGQDQVSGGRAEVFLG